MKKEEILNIIKLSEGLMIELEVLNSVFEHSASTLLEKSEENDEQLEQFIKNNKRISKQFIRFYRNIYSAVQNKK